MKEKEFGFIITQEISHTMTKNKLADKMTNFLAERKKDLMKDLKLPENKIHTDCYYDRDSREYKGFLLVKNHARTTVLINSIMKTRRSGRQKTASHTRYRYTRIIDFPKKQCPASSLTYRG